MDLSDVVCEILRHTTGSSSLFLLRAYPRAVKNATLQHMVYRAYGHDIRFARVSYIVPNEIDVIERCLRCMKRIMHDPVEPMANVIYSSGTGPVPVPVISVTTFIHQTSGFIDKFALLFKWAKTKKYLKRINVAIGIHRQSYIDLNTAKVVVLHGEHKQIVVPRRYMFACE